MCTCTSLLTFCYPIWLMTAKEGGNMHVMLSSGRGCMVPPACIAVHQPAQASTNLHLCPSTCTGVDQPARVSSSLPNRMCDSSSFQLQLSQLRPVRNFALQLAYNALHTQAWSPSSCSHMIPRGRASEFIFKQDVWSCMVSLTAAVLTGLKLGHSRHAACV